MIEKIERALSGENMVYKKCQKCRQKYPTFEDDSTLICGLCDGPLSYESPSYDEQAYMKHESGIFMSPEEEKAALNLGKDKIGMAHFEGRFPEFKKVRK